MNPYSVDFWKPMTDSLYRNDDLEKKSALNQMVHRTMDRSGRDRFVASGTENGINLSPSTIKDALLKKEGSDPSAAKAFRGMQAESIMNGAKPGWSQSDSQKFYEEKGRHPGANDYSPGDQEINKRYRGLQLTDALMGPDTETRYYASSSPTAGMGANTVAEEYDPREVAYEQFAENSPEKRSILQKDLTGSYVNAETLMNGLNNQYMGAGRVFVPLQERGMANMQEYLTHRTKRGEDFLDKLVNGASEFRDDMDDSIYRTLGYDIPHSETSQKVQNRMLKKQYQDLASKPVDEGDGFDGNGGSDIRQADLDYLDYPDLDGLTYRDARKHTTGEYPGMLEEIAGEGLPMLMDATTLLGPLAVGKYAGLGAGLSALLSDLMYEELPMNLGLTGAATMLAPRENKTMEQLDQEVKAINQQHQDFTTKAAPEIKKRLQNFLHPAEAKQISGIR